MNAPKLPIPNPEDWTTIEGAASILNVSRRTVERMIGDQRLNGYRFYATLESQRFLWVPQVQELAAARRRSAPAA